HVWRAAVSAWRRCFTTVALVALPYNRSTKEIPMRIRLWRLVVGVWLALPVALPAQTFLISDTSRASWTASPDNAATFGTPPMPVVTSYVAHVFLKTAVPGTTEPATPPAFTFDFGKPMPDAQNTQTSALLKALTPALQPNVEYALFLHAAGPGRLPARRLLSRP